MNQLAGKDIDEWDERKANTQAQSNVQHSPLVQREEDLQSDFDFESEEDLSDFDTDSAEDFMVATVSTTTTGTGTYITLDPANPWRLKKEKPFGEDEIILGLRVYTHRDSPARISGNVRDY